MPRKPETLSPNEKVRIALECLTLEATGESNASKIVAQEYNLSSRAVTALKTQALEAIQQAFEPKVTSLSKTIDRHLISRNLDALLGTAASRDQNPSPLEEHEGEEEREEDTLLDEVWEKIQDHNSSADEKKRIYPTSTALAKITGLRPDLVQGWLDEHEAEVDEHAQEFRITPGSNKGKRDLKALLGL